MIGASLAVAASAASAQPALAETTSPSPAAQIAHAGFLPYMDPPPGGAATVCLVDTGVDLNPDTASTVVEREALDGGDPGDVWDRKHGTEMAMVMGAPINDWGTVGAWPLVKIVSVRAMAPGATSFPFSAYAKAIHSCLKRPTVRVINLSFSGPRPSDADVSYLNDYVGVARRAGMSIVAGAGNNAGAVEWPGAAPQVFTVAATGLRGTACPFSAHGPEVAISAPGCDLELTDATAGTPISYGGTSPAAAFASAALAAVRSYRPDFSAADAEELLKRTADSGRLDVEAAFRTAGLGAQVDNGLARVPAPSTQPDQATVLVDETRSPALVMTPSWPKWASPTPETIGNRWPAPRLRKSSCSEHGLKVWLANRPSRATVVVQTYRQRTEFARRLLTVRRARRAQMRLSPTFDLATLTYVGKPRSASRPIELTSCGRHAR